MDEKEGRRRPIRRLSREKAEQLVAGFQASGLTYREFAKRNDLGVSTLARYLKRYRRQPVSSEGSGQWIAVEVAEPPVIASELVLVLGEGRRIEVRRGFDASTLRELVRVLEQA